MIETSEMQMSYYANTWHLLVLPFLKFFFFQRLCQIVTEALQQQTSETMREEASCFLLVISAFNFTLIFSLTS